MATYMQTGSTISVNADGAFVVHDQLPAAVYNIVLPPMQPPRLEMREPLTMPKKIYGDLNTITDHILEAFDKRTANTGVLLSGMKGSGKTLIARNISNRLLAAGIPTIIVSPTMVNPGIIAFLQMISSPCMLLFDEIDKIPGDNHEAATATDCMLGFLDGLSCGKKLSVLTVNSRDRVNPNFIDRPGRILYHYKFEGISVETAKQFCLDRLHNQEHWRALERIVQLSRNISFDMLSAVVEECNRFNCGPMQALQVLNVIPTISGSFRMTPISERGYRIMHDEYETYQLSFERQPWWVHLDFWVELPEEEITERMTECYSIQDEYVRYNEKHKAAAGRKWVNIDDVHFDASQYESIDNGVVRYKWGDGFVFEFTPYAPTYRTMEWD